MAQQLDVRDVREPEPEAARSAARGKALDHRLAVLGPAHLEGIDVLALAGEAVVGGLPIELILPETALRGVDLSFYGDVPGASAIDPFPVDTIPVREVRQDRQAFVIQGAIGLLRKVEEQVAILGDDVHQHLDHLP